MVRWQAARLHEAATWIGRATAYANHCPLDALVQVAPDAKRCFIRDSDGLQPRRPRGRKRKADVTALPSSTASSCVAQVAAAAAVAEQRAAELGAGTAEMRNCGTLHSATATPAAAAWYSSRAKRARLSKQRGAARDNAQLREWLDRSLPSMSAPAVSASARMEALRGRLAERRQ